MGKPGLLAAGAAVLTALVIAVAGCGGGSNGDPPASGGFSWLRPSSLPHGWRTASLPASPARLAYPGSWRAIESDPGTRSAAVRSDGRIVGYLNATPRQGEETLANWSTFRLDHNRDEGDTNEKLLAAATDLRFRNGHGSCVLDDYTSSSGHRYREIACIVAGARATTVVVGAAPPGDWHSQGPALERAISAFKT